MGVATAARRTSDIDALRCNAFLRSFHMRGGRFMSAELADQAWTVRVAHQLEKLVAMGPGLSTPAL
jgi:hypothetical protein